jgi:hypothetical protein
MQTATHKSTFIQAIKDVLGQSGESNTCQVSTRADIQVSEGYTPVYQHPSFDK